MPLGTRLHWILDTWFISDRSIELNTCHHNVKVPLLSIQIMIPNLNPQHEIPLWISRYSKRSWICRDHSRRTWWYAHLINAVNEFVVKSYNKPNNDDHRNSAAEVRPVLGLRLVSQQLCCTEKVRFFYEVAYRFEQFHLFWLSFFVKRFNNLNENYNTILFIFFRYYKK